MKGKRLKPVGSETGLLVGEVRLFAKVELRAAITSQTTTNLGKLIAGGHDKEAAAIAARCPNGANIPFFISITALENVLAFIFHHQNAAIGQLADEIRVEPVGRGL